MDAYLFLIIAGLLIAVGVLVVVVRNREPRRENQAISDFQTEMRALSPESRRGTDSRLKPMPRDRGTNGG